MECVIRNDDVHWDFEVPTIKGEAKLIVGKHETRLQPMSKLIGYWKTKINQVDWRREVSAPRVVFWVEAEHCAGLNTKLWFTRNNNFGTPMGLKLASLKDIPVRFFHANYRLRRRRLPTITRTLIKLKYFNQANQYNQEEPFSRSTITPRRCNHFKSI